MTSPTPVTCPHELRPGTRVCLHCRRAEREAKAARQRAVLTRVGFTGAAIAAVAYAGLAGFRTWQGNGSPSLRSLITLPASLEAAPVRTLTVSGPTAAPVAAFAVNAPATPLVGDSMPASDSTRNATVAPVSGDSMAAPSVAPIDSATSVAPAAPAAVAAPVSQPIAAPAAPPVAPAPAPVAPPLKPAVAEGRTELQNGIYAVRRGDTVTVHFDTPEARTRRPEKFEQIVRATLPAVHGATAVSILAGIATGNLVGPGDTITAPQAGGISLRGGNGAAFSLLPQTRLGRDGPLVVAYRVVPAR